MRIDKFLVLAQLIKHRKEAQSACEAGKIILNERIAKSSKEVRPGDKIIVHYSGRVIGIQVLGIPEDHAIKKDEARLLYRVLFEDKMER